MAGEISRSIRGSIEDSDSKDDLILRSLFINAPVTSVDCGRGFSRFKDLLSEKWMNMPESHLRDKLIMQRNYDDSKR